MMNFKLTRLLQLLLFLTFSIVLLACGDDDTSVDDIDEPTDPAETVLEVETLVTSIASNDAVTVDSDGNIYTSEFGEFGSNGGSGTRILKITPDGTVSDFITGLQGPLGTTIDDDGNFYVVDANTGSSGNVIKVNPNGEKTNLATINGWPAGIVQDDGDNLLVSNFSLGIISKISADGTLSTLVEDSRLAGCVGIVLDDDGNILLGNYNTGDILSVTPSGTVSLIATIDDIVQNFGIGYITYHDDFIYATGIGTHKIFSVSLAGEVEVFAGNGAAVTLDGPLLEASFKNPNGIGIDKENDILYIQDWGALALRKIELDDD